MIQSWRLLDRILRGEATRPTELRDGRLAFPVAGLSIVGIVLAMIYGACVGCYSIFRALEAIKTADTFGNCWRRRSKRPPSSS